MRIVAATNRDLDAQVRAGHFRSDLMYRLKVFQISIPPLRERTGDVTLLARHFMTQLAQRYGRPELRLDDSALQALEKHDWPGNVRELRNVLERAVLLQHSAVISARELLLPTAARPVSPPPAGGNSGADATSVSLEAVEREHLLRALEACRWNVSQAARKLGISRDTLRYRMERHGLQR